MTINQLEHTMLRNFFLLFLFLGSDIHLYADQSEKNCTVTVVPFLCGAVTATALLIAVAKNKRPLPKLSSLFRWNKHEEDFKIINDEIKRIQEQLAIIKRTQEEHGINLTAIKEDTHFTAQILKAVIEHNKGMIDRLLLWFKRKNVIEIQPDQKKL
jgi:hypothetical protein